jgi:hypothetical protein
MAWLLQKPNFQAMLGLHWRYHLKCESIPHIGRSSETLCSRIVVEMFGGIFFWLLCLLSMSDLLALINHALLCGDSSVFLEIHSLTAGERDAVGRWVHVGPVHCSDRLLMDSFFVI